MGNSDPSQTEELERLRKQVQALEAAIAAKDREIGTKDGIISQFARRVVNLRSQIRESEETSHTDGLTGLLLKTELERALPGIVRRAKNSSEPLSMIFVDLNDFREVNTAHGHMGGDAVLREAARRLRRVLRLTDLAGRVGGEEFAVILPGTPKKMAERVATRIYAAIAKDPYRIPDDGEVIMSASVGWACVADTGYSHEELYKAADQAMYRGKAKKGSGEPTLSD